MVSTGRRVIDTAPQKLFPAKPAGKRTSKARAGAAARSSVSASSEAMPMATLAPLFASFPFPQRVSVKLQYADSFNTAADGVSGSTYGAEQVFRANSLFDPDQTNVGHQPYGYDQLAALYSRYKVTAVDVHAVFTTPGGNYDMFPAMVLSPPNNPVTLAGVYFPTVSEKPGSQVGHLGTSGTRQCVFRAHFKIRDLVGMTQQQFDDNIEEYSALIGANPSRVPTIKFANASSSSAGTSQNSILFVKLVYHATFWDRTNLSAS